MGWTDYGIENAVEGVRKNVRAEVPAQVPGNFLVIEGTQEQEEYQMLIDADTGEIIMQGDDYHDKIAYQIQGFFKALEFFDYPYNKEIKTGQVD